MDFEAFNLVFNDLARAFIDSMVTIRTFGASVTSVKEADKKIWARQKYLKRCAYGLEKKMAKARRRRH